MDKLLTHFFFIYRFYWVKQFSNQNVWSALKLMENCEEMHIRNMASKQIFHWISVVTSHKVLPVFWIIIEWFWSNKNLVYWGLLEYRICFHSFQKSVSGICRSYYGTNFVKARSAVRSKPEVLYVGVAWVVWRHFQCLSKVLLKEA